MKSLLLTIGMLLFTAGLAYAECRTVEIDGEEMELCDKGTQDDATYFDYSQDPLGLGTLDEPRQAFPRTQQRISDIDITTFDDGTRCFSQEISGIVQTNCY